MLVKDISPGSISGYPWDLTVANNLLFFTATNEQSDFYLWRTDGTAAGTFPVVSNNPIGSTKNPWSLIKGGDQIFFTSFPTTSEHLWRTDGTLCGTVLLTEEHIEGIAFSDLIFLNNKILFSGEIPESEHGTELYAYHVEGMPPSRCQTISFDPLVAKKYGDPDFILTASASSGLPVQFSSLDPSIVSINENVVTILKAGSTTITASQPGDASFNAASAVGQLLVVDKASLTATADDQTIFYGDAIPTLTISYSGFKRSDDESTIDSQPVATTDAIQGSAPNVYPILLSGGLDDNYTITIVPGTLKINKAKQTINFSISNKTLGDLPFTASATATSGLPVTITTFSQKINLSGQTVTILEAGNVTIHASQSGNEYFEAATPIAESFCINPQKPQLTIYGINTSTPIIESSSSTGNQWFLNSIAMANENQSVIEVKEGGEYTASVTHDNCVSELSDPVLMIVTDINDEFSEKVTLFPNPTTSKLRLQLKSFQNSVKKITIIDAKGMTKDVINIQDQSPEIEIDVSNYASGPYIMLINSNDFVLSQIFIKK
jgi:ELWxxDGT repeat protein